MREARDKTDTLTLDGVLRCLDEEFATLSVGRRRFPHLFESGLPDAAVHAAGVTYLAALGWELGITAIAEYPITVHAPDEWRDAGRVFPDSVWFHPRTGLPWIVFEFERFETGDENKIRSKAENLALAWHQSRGSVELCGFVYWLQSSRAPKSIAALQQVFASGFRRGDRMIPPPRARHVIIKAVACRVGAGSAGVPDAASVSGALSKGSGDLERVTIVQSMQLVAGTS